MRKFSHSPSPTTNDNDNKMKLTDHPIAGLFPLIPADQLQELADSIARTGQREEIVLLGGKILDGRNRYRACELAGVKPATRDFDVETDGPSPLRFVMDLNLTRRHLSTSQRAAIAAESLKLMQQQAAPKTSATPAPAPVATDDHDGDEEKTRLALAEKFGMGGASSYIDGALAAKQGFPIDSCEMEAGHPARGLWEEGWKAQTAAQAEDAQPPTVIDDTKTPTKQEMADQMGVSKRQVEHANNLTPEHRQEVLDGKKTVNAARQEEQAEELKKQKAEELKKIASVCGKEFADAVARNVILKTVAELAAFLALDAEQQRAVQPLISTGWKVKKALAHAMNAVDDSTTLGELINKAISTGGDILVTEVNGWEITALRVGPEDQQPPAKKGAKKKPAAAGA